MKLIFHSDCEGALTPGECGAIAPRLRAEIGRWENCDPDRLRGEHLASGMERAAQIGENLRFR